MFKAVNTQSGEEIVILNPKWENQVGFLRLLDRRDILVCQGCKQPVRVRAGRVKRRHFAHKHLANCPYMYKSPALLEARAVLYEWLVSKFGEAATLEKELDGDRFPHAVDCWVEREPASFAYWIIDARMKPDKRENLKLGFHQAGAIVHWIFTAEMLHEDEDHANWLHLTTTERDFMQQSVYDEVFEKFSLGVGKSLHYLDPATKVLTTFRGLHLVHAPQVYAGCKLANGIAEVLALPKTGELVHPGEYEQLEKYRQEKKQLEEKRREQEQRRALELKTPPPGSPRHDSATRPPSSAPYTVEATCMICGKKTTDWWYIDNATNMCKCRECLRAGRTKA